MTLSQFGWNTHWNEAFAPFAAQGFVPGRVIGEHRTHYQVATEAAEISATLTGRLRNAAAQRSDLPGVGDYVALRLADGDGPASVEGVLPRSSALIRKAAGEQRPQLLASNVDTVLIVMALDGDFNLARLERYLALVEASGAEAVIVANKLDLAVDGPGQIAEIRAIAPGKDVHAISAKADNAVTALETYFANAHTVALIGSSGVGKSTLTNKLLGEAVQATQEVRSHDNRGRHTTTHRQLFLRPLGGSIMDTPGMRGLELWDPDTETIAPNFADIEALALECKFTNCRHETEPSCAVRAAVAAGTIDADHLARFRERPGQTGRRR
jgi:ribosome biogenesis GTPase / thiamine phosphate phosphatase